jgi:hypothetical protein
MEPANAAADTTEALQAALDAARRERETLAERLSTVERVIADLNHAVQGGARGGAGRRAGRKAAKKGATRKGAAKRGARKQTARKSARTGKRATRRPGRRRRAGRTDRVVEIVTASREPLTTGEVRSQLAGEEPDVSSKLVSAALTYAQRKGRIDKSQDGRWKAQ